MATKIPEHYIKGYVRIKIEGYFIEKFINICTNRNIRIWNIKKESDSILYANINIKDFKDIRKIANKTKCRVKIKSKKGVPFIINKYKKRKAFIVVLIVISILIFMSSNFIWNIEVKGNNKISKDEIINLLKDEGIEIGKLKNKINTKKIIEDIRLKREDIAWVGIRINGTNAKVEVVETEEKPEIIDENEYCNIISDKEAIIVKATADNGTLLVESGDVVKKGTLLIGGWIEGKYTGTRYVHAKGSISAKVLYTKTAKVNLKQIKRQKTGKSEKKYGIKLNNFQINLYKSLSKFKNYDTIYNNKQIKIFSDFYIPVSIIECNNFEIQEEEIEYTIDEAKNLAIEKTLEDLKNMEVDTNMIKNRTINTKQTEESVEVEVTYEVLEEIGTNEKIVF